MQDSSSKKPERKPQRSPLNQLPNIFPRQEQLSTVIEFARDDVKEWNKRGPQPTYYDYGGASARLNSRGNLELLDVDTFYGDLARMANWFEADQSHCWPINPPRSVAVDFVKNPPPDLPGVDRSVKSPVFLADGKVAASPGYYPDARLLYASGLRIPRLPANPSTKELRKAISLIQDELFGDFPFADQPSRAHAMALFLSPYARELIRGHIPIYGITAPTPGTGKTLLVRVNGQVNLGGEPLLTTMNCRDGNAEEEHRKKLTALLLGGASLVVIDNVRGRLDSPTLAAVTTTDTWSDRILGASRVAALASKTIWVVTGNNLLLSSELARRSIGIRLDPRTEQPWMRKDFRHKNILAWCKKNRAALVHAALVTIQSWVVAGRPLSRKTLGSFEEFAETMGGILDHAGVAGFLEGAFQEGADDEQDDERMLVAAWRQNFGTTEVSASRILGVIEGNEIPLRALRGGSRQAQLAQVGEFLKTLRDRVIDGCVIHARRDGHSKAWMYRLTENEQAKK